MDYKGIRECHLKALRIMCMRQLPGGDFEDKIKYDAADKVRAVARKYEEECGRVSTFTRSTG